MFQANADRIRWCRCRWVPDSLMAVATNLRSPARSSGLDTKSKAPSLSARTAVSILPWAVITATGTLGEYCCIHLTSSKSIAVGQLHVGQAQIELLGLEQALRVGDAVCRSRIEIHALQRDGQQLAKIRLVVDY